ncbi:MAG: TetR/AcrR family transcriptional regulator C-terminal domain-containing protein [Oscillospiraceae bacterium]
MSRVSHTKIALAESLKALMHEKKFARITVDEICEKADVSRRNFYNHFLDKYDLIAWTYDYYFCKMVQRRDDFTVMDYLPQICYDLYEDMPFYRNAFDTDGQNSFRSYCVERLKPLFMHDFADVFPSEKAADFLIKHICYAFFDYYLDWFDSDDPMPPKEYINYIRKTVAAVSKRMSDIFNGTPAEAEKWE